MMFLEFAIWGAWLPVATPYFQGQRPLGLGFTGTQSGILFALMPLCSLIMSPILGQLADRVFNSEKMMALLHFISAITLVALSRQTTFAGTFVCLAIHCLAFSPTIPLSTSICMHHLEDPTRQFGNIRVAGTIGWMISGWVLTMLRVTGKLESPTDLFLLAAVMGFALSFFCLFLPKTPPAKSSENRYAFGAALKLFNNSNFAMLMIVAFIICAQFDFFYMFTPQFLGAPTSETLAKILPESYLGSGGAGLGLSAKMIPFVMSLAQVSEIVMMLALPFLLKSMGYRWTLYMGIVAWFARFALNVLVPTLPGTIASIMMHGFCVACFMIAGSLYVAKIAPQDIRASSQALYSLVTFGLGRIVGSLVGGMIQNANTTNLPVKLPLPGLSVLEKLVNYPAIFAIPTGMTFVCVLAFPFLFRIRKGELDS